MLLKQTAKVYFARLVIGARLLPIQTSHYLVQEEHTVQLKVRKALNATDYVMQVVCALKHLPILVLNHALLDSSVDKVLGVHQCLQ